jgi:phosphoribosylformimino-5-aminoimidazole carboxamide ribotide isomerase
VKLYPALDILDGHVVRLAQGDFDRSTTYGAEPLAAAKLWAKAGADRLHIVDLDGARAGHPVNLDGVRAIVQETGLEVQVGGGLRSIEAIDAALAAGASRVIIGTAAFNDPYLLTEALERHGKKIAVSVDARKGIVATAGWLEATDLQALDAIRALDNRGVSTIIYTSVDRDGTMEGPDTADVSEIADAVGDALLIYAGGIGSLDDLRALAQLERPELAGVVVGKALYENRFTLAEAEAALCT